MSHRCRTIVLSVLVALTIAQAAVCHGQGSGVSPELERVRAALRGRAYEDAVQAADRAIAAGIDEVDRALYLRSLAQYHLEQFDLAVETIDGLLDRFPDSSWYRKARFLKAQAHVAQRSYEPAEEIFEEEAFRLLDPKRKETIARVLVQFADELASDPDPADVGAPQPDYGKAYNLLTRAMNMEIARDLRDEVVYKLGLVSQKMPNHQQAVTHFRGYLDEFDPDWMGPVGSVERMRSRTRLNPPLAGGHVHDARYRLGKSQLALGHYAAARQNFDDLIALLRASIEREQGPDDARERIADATWLTVRTYNMPTLEGGDLEVAIKAARAFLRDHPGHLHGIEGAWLIAQTYHTQGRSDDAIADYRAFIDGSLYKLPEGEGGEQPLHRLNRTAIELEGEWRPGALFNIGSIEFAQRRYEKAIDTWRSYVTRHPNGANWAGSQRGIIDATFNLAVDAVAEEDYDHARTLLHAFLATYPLEPRAAQVMFVLGQIDASGADALHEEERLDDARARYAAALDQWSKLISKYPNTEESSLALYRTGVIQEEKLQQHEKALQSYRRVNWGSWARHAQARIRIMTEKNLRLRTERKFRTNENPFVTLDVRNIERLTVRQYFLDPEAYFRKTHTMGGFADLDIGLIEADRTWEVEIAEYEQYRPLTQSVEIPFDEGAPGVCVVNLSNDEFEATTIVIRSDLDLVVRSSRREMLVFVQNMLRDAPAEGVTLLLSDGSEIVFRGTTGPDGVYRHQFAAGEAKDDLRLFAVANGHIASNALGLSGARVAEGLSRKGYIYTDRPAYRPGQTVSVRGIIREVVAGSYHLPQATEYLVNVIDPQGRLLREEHLMLSDFGTFATTFDLYADAPVGQYTITAREAKEKSAPFSAHFQVQQFELRNLALTMETDSETYFRGETIHVTIRAAYYWGTPAADQSIRYVLPDGREFIEKTDDAGVLTLEYDTRGVMPGAVLPFVARIEGEDVFTSKQVYVPAYGFAIEVHPPSDTVLAGQPFDVVVKTSTPDNKPAARDLRLVVLRAAAIKDDPVLSQVPWITRQGEAPAPVTIAEHTITTDEKTGEGRIQLTLAEGGAYTLRVEGDDRFEQTVTAQAPVSVSGDDDITKLRLFAESDRLQVGEDTEVRIHSRLDTGLALITFEGESILSYRIASLHEGMNELRFKVGHEHFPNFAMNATMMSDRDLHTVRKVFEAERQLSISIKPADETAQPGEEGRVDVTVTDQLGQPVEAELSLALVNEALYAIYADTTPAIRDFFQAGARRFVDFRVAATNGFAHEARTTKVVIAIVEEEGRRARAESEMQQLGELQEQLKVLDLAANSYFDRDQAADDMVRRRAGRQLAFGARTRGGGGGGFGGGGALGGGAPQRERMAGRELADSRAKFGPGPKSTTGLITLNHAELDLAFFGGVAPTPRRDIPESGWWSPAIRTDADGKAVVNVPYPDIATKWRLTARGVTKETLVGQATAQVVTRDDFFVEIKSPRIIVEGDKVRVLARVHNLTDFAGDVSLTLDVTSGENRYASISRTAAIEAEGTTEVLFDAFTAPQVGTLDFTVTARGGDHADALVRTVDVTAWGLPYADHGGGLADGSVTLKLKLPKGLPYTSRWMTIAVSPDLKREVIEMALRTGPIIMPADGKNMQYLRPRIVSRSFAGSELLAVAHALDYARSAGATPADQARLRARVSSLVSAVVLLQEKDGGWSWMARGRSDWAITSTTFWALSEARGLGLTVDANTIARSETYLKNAFQSASAADHERKAIILHALSKNDAAEFRLANTLYRERNALSSLALGYTALALANLDHADYASEVAVVLESTARRTQANGRLLAHWESRRPRYPWLEQQTHTTALAALALMKVKPGSPMIRPAVEFLLDRRGCYAIPAGHGFGAAVAAVARYFGEARFAQADFDLTIVVNGRELKTIAREAEGATGAVMVPPDVLNDGENTVQFTMRGRGTFGYAATLYGFSGKLADPKTLPGPWVRSRRYYHARLLYEGAPITAASTSPVENVEIGQRVRVHVDFENYGYQGYLVVEEPLPAGMTLVPGSLSGNFTHHEVSDGRILMYTQPGRAPSDFSYELVGYASGDYRMLPTVIRDVLDPAKVRVGRAGSLRVLAPGEASPDPYRINDGERFALGRAHFDDGRYSTAIEYLWPLFDRERQYQQRDVARMLLWINTTDEHFDADRVVRTFEVLSVHHPDLTIPFDKILTVGRAYRMLGEFERAWLVFRATIESSFLADSNVAAVLEDEGQLLGSLDFQEDLWWQYPDLPDVVSSLFALSQTLYDEAPDAHKLAERARRGRIRIPGAGERDPGAMDESEPTRLSMLAETVRLLYRFITLYPEDPLVDDAAFSLANAFLDLKDYGTVVSMSERFGGRYDKSRFASSFQYMAALGYFWQRQYEPAITAAGLVANGESEDRDFARYILGQIYHAQGDPVHAIEWYTTVDETYPDAKEAIDFFQRKHVALDEVHRVLPGEPVRITLSYRNIAEATLRVYKVDLMKLYLREKNLSQITGINLAGIEPLVIETVSLGDGRDYVDKEREVALDLEDEGAYLVICRGDNLFTSGLVLITPLKIEVQEDATSGRVRVNLIDETTGLRPAGIHVKAVGSADQTFRSGETDLRGVFVADGLRGEATAIARAGESRYAFYRGERWLGAPASAQIHQGPAEKKQIEVDYKSNLERQNLELQMNYRADWDKQRRAGQRGVEVRKAQ